MVQYRCFNKYLSLLLFPLLFIPFHLKAQKFTREDTLRGTVLPMRQYDVRYYHLLVRVDTARQVIYGVNTIRFTTPRQMRQIQVDLFKNFDIRGINQAGLWCHYTREGDHIYVDLVKPVKPGDTGSVDVLYAGKPQVAKKAPWDGGFIWTKDSTGKPWIAVACEGLGASSWWPCKDHLSDEPDSMDISLEAPYGLQGIANGSFIGATNQFNGYNRFDWRVHYPINTYDVTINVGNYVTVHDTFRSKAGPISLDYYVMPYNKVKAEAYFSKQVKPMLRCFEKYFGPYPFTKDGYALVEDPYWGMEHQSAVAYGNNFKINEYGFDFIIVHESAHEWWGNSLSVPDEAEMWLHESFATYAESLLLEWRDGKKTAISYLEMQKLKIKNEEPMIGPQGVNFHGRNDNDIYYKGTWMLHTLRNMVNNDSLWFSIIYSFQQQHKYGIVSTPDFVKHVDSLTGQSYDSFFKQYLEYAPIPKLVYSVESKGKKAILKYRLEANVDLQMPVEMQAGNKSFRITAGPDWKTMTFKRINPKNLHLRTDLFYVNEERQ